MHEHATGATRARPAPRRARSDLTERLLDAVDERTLQILALRQQSTRRRGRLVRRLLLVADLVGLVVAFVLAEMLSGDQPLDHLSPHWEYVLFFATLPAWLGVAKLYGLYDRDEDRMNHTTTDDLASVFHIVTVGVWLLAIGSRLTSLVEPTLSKLALFWLLALALMATGRLVARAISRRSIAYLQNTIIVGAGEVGQAVARKLMRHPEYGLNVVGFVDSEPKERHPELGHVTLLGHPARLPEMIDLLDVERVIIAFSTQSHRALLALVRRLKERDVQIDIVPRLFEVVAPTAGLHNLEGLALLPLRRVRLSKSTRVVKRAADVVVSLAALVILGPLLLGIALAIKWDSPGPVFFRQVRVGERGRTFRIFKFRTMAADAETQKGHIAHLSRHAHTDPRMFKVPNDPRTTRIGQFLRRYAIDELPQLVNVLVGDMSLVGPRPLILDEDRYVGTWARRRLELKPGITGLWQVHGRSQIPFEEMVTLDYLYVTNWSLLSDLALLLRTIPVVVRGDRSEMAVQAGADAGRATAARSRSA